MSNPYSQRVNRQLLLARQHLDIPVDASSASGRLRLTGMLESALFHLYRAYLEMLRELASNYQLENPDQIDDLSRLVAAMQKVGKTAAEIEELQELERQGFVGEMLASWRHLFAGAAASGKEQRGVRPEGMISLRSVANWELDPERLAGWHQRLTEISDRHRDIMVEY